MNAAITSCEKRQHLPKKPMYFVPMHLDDVPDVIEIEHAIYPYPWVYESFVSALKNGYDAWLMKEEDEKLAGYFVAKRVIDESHLLQIAVRPDLQGQGYGRILLDKVLSVVHGAGLAFITLEVRPSNTRARKMYDDYGFLVIGMRKNYYLAENNKKESAILMRLTL